MNAQRIWGPGVALLVASIVLLAALPTPAAAGPVHLLALFLHEGSSGPELALEPSAATSQKMPLLKPQQPSPGVDAPACAAARTCDLASLGTISLPAPAQLAAPAALSLWLSTEATAMPITALTVVLEKTGATTVEIATFTYGATTLPRKGGDGALHESIILTLGTEPVRVSLTDDTTTAARSLAAGDQLRLRVSALSGPAAATAPSPIVGNVFAHFDKTHPTNVLLTLDGPSPLQLGGAPLGLYLDGTGLSGTYPESTTAERRIVTSSVHPTAPTAIVFGPAALSGPVTALGDGLFTLHYQLVPKPLPTEATQGPGPSALVRLTFTVSLDLGPSRVTSSAQVNPAPTSGTTTSPAPSPTVLIALPLTGAEIPAEPKIEVKIYGALASQLADLVILYGSSDRASGLLIPVGGGAPPPPPSPEPTTSSTEPTTEPPPTPTTETATPTPEPTPTTPTPASNSTEPSPEPTQTSAANLSSPSPTTTSLEHAGPAAATRDQRGTVGAWGLLGTLAALSAALIGRRRG